ncbi:hypothetical protein CspHIS471_0307800 [Cutaneotrichosporon sp. HIS471]|nr:hypothetical protein CspHIS471_0307800 [Cutaneotrichosporon sp. HIS471]
MGFFSSTPEEKEEKLLHKEQKNDEKAVKQALKDLEKAHKVHRKAEKAEHDATEDYQKAIRREEKLAAELIKLQNEHESSVQAKYALAKEVTAKQDELVRLEGEVTLAQTALEKTQVRARENTERREKRLAQLAGAGAAVAGAGVATAATAAGSKPASPETDKGEGEVPAGEDRAALAAPAVAAGTAGVVAPNLPPRSIDTNVLNEASAPSAASQSPSGQFAAPPRHPVADATAPHVTSPTSPQTPPQLPPRQGTTETFATAQTGPSATSVTAPQLPNTSVTAPQLPNTSVTAPQLPNPVTPQQVEQVPQLESLSLSDAPVPAQAQPINLNPNVPGQWP